jgi:uncharacterized OB-fold protein
MTNPNIEPHSSTTHTRQKEYLTGNRCPKCGKLIKPEYILCFECYQKENLTGNRCTKCGKPTKPEYILCNQCYQNKPHRKDMKK